MGASACNATMRQAGALLESSHRGSVSTPLLLLLLLLRVHPRPSQLTATPRSLVADGVVCIPCRRLPRPLLLLCPLHSLRLLPPRQFWEHQVHGGGCAPALRPAVATEQDMAERLRRAAGARGRRAAEALQGNSSEWQCTVLAAAKGSLHAMAASVWSCNAVVQSAEVDTPLQAAAPCRITARPRHWKAGGGSGGGDSSSAPVGLPNSLAAFQPAGAAGRPCQRPLRRLRARKAT